MRKIIYTILFALLFTSCGDFLNESPRHNWDVDKAMSTYNNAEQAVNGIYPRFMVGDPMNMKLSLSYSLRAGLMQVAAGNKEFHFSYTQMDSPIDLWKYAYQAINAANYAINEIPKVSDASCPTPTAKMELIAEARLLRGYLNSILLLNYGLWWDTDDSKYGIVYRDLVTNVPNAYMPRITVGESWTKIFEDLDFAIANMPEQMKTAKTASKLFAKAYKAKLLLIRGAERKNATDLQTAKGLVDEAIASLAANKVAVQGDMKTHFNQSWDSQENIFVRYLEDNASRTTNAGHTCDYGICSDYGTKFIINGVEQKQSEVDCGLRYGQEWMRADPRWYIATGKARHPETWNEEMYWAWTKIYRKGRYAGKLDPIDEKYAVYLMRAPELYIMQAELRARTGSSMADAVAPINTFRAMRTNPKLTPVPTPADEQAFWDVIFQEYCKELILENGAEYFASLRIMKGSKTYMEEIKGAEYRYERTFRQYPIPNDEVINNPHLKGMQNPGQE